VARKNGHEQTEIDALAALRPDALRRITLDALAPFYDFTLDERCAAAGGNGETRRKRSSMRTRNG